MTSTDRIEKTILLRAPRSRVWRALTDAWEFGAWLPKGRPSVERSPIPATST
jgi:uncharacterized protein YndB with AHSA1/START domain